MHFRVWQEISSEFGKEFLPSLARDSFRVWQEISFEFSKRFLRLIYEKNNNYIV